LDLSTDSFDSESLSTIHENFVGFNFPKLDAKFSYLISIFFYDFGTFLNGFIGNDGGSMSNGLWIL